MTCISSLPYCEAVILEAIRAFMSYTFGIAHRALKDTKLSGYDIPKDTMVVAMFSGIMNDPKNIKNPFTFDPNNFLNENGKLSIPKNIFRLLWVDIDASAKLSQKATCS